MLRDYIKSQNFNSTTKVIDGIKSIFSSVLNYILQCEIEESFVYSNHKRVSSDGSKNYINSSIKSANVLSKSIILFSLARYKP